MGLPEIEEFIRIVREEGWKATPSPLERILTLIQAHPDQIGDLIEAIIEELPEGGTYLSAALSYLTVEEFPRLVEYAITALREDPENEAAEEIINHASLQSPNVLGPYRESLFALGITGRSYYRSPWKWLWREAGDSDFLRSYLEDTTRPAAIREAAWRAALETRHLPLIKAAIASWPSQSPRMRRDNLPVGAYLRQVGFEETSEGLRALYPAPTYHLRFEYEDYPFEASTPSWRRAHPTWHLPKPDSPVMSFGGSVTPPTECALCGTPLCHLVTLDPIPAGLGISSVDRLVLATCLSCLGWESGAEVLFYRHNTNGSLADNIGYDGPRITPKFPAGPFLPTYLRLAPTPDRWRWQEWGSSQQENLHRVGGSPSWVQDADYPTCPLCGTTMPFLLQLDSDLPTERDSEFLWGSGGMAYLHWCDSCRVSAIFWQCT